MYTKQNFRYSFLPSILVLQKQRLGDCFAVSLAESRAGRDRRACPIENDKHPDDKMHQLILLQFNIYTKQQYVIRQNKYILNDIESPPRFNGILMTY